MKCTLNRVAQIYWNAFQWIIKIEMNLCSSLCSKVGAKLTNNLSHSLFASVRHFNTIHTAGVYSVHFT